jgi:CTP-dependent riboflavin kinase
MTMSLSQLKERIESMSKYNQIEVLRILKRYEKVTLNENKNGTFINLTEQSPEVINSLENYVNYVTEQQKQLSSVEDEKERIEQTFFSNNVNRL